MSNSISEVYIDRFLDEDVYTKFDNNLSDLEQELTLAESYVEEGIVAKVKEKARSLGWYLGFGLVAAFIFRRFVSKYRDCNRKYSRTLNTLNNLRCRAQFAEKAYKQLESSKKKVCKDYGFPCINTINKEIAKWRSTAEKFKKRVINYES